MSLAHTHTPEILVILLYNNIWTKRKGISFFLSFRRAHVPLSKCDREDEEDDEDKTIIMLEWIRFSR